jgi:hypothetical protein
MLGAALALLLADPAPPRAAGGCSYDFSTSSFEWCLSSTGNLQRLYRLPSFSGEPGDEAIDVGLAVEGYAICVDNKALYHDRGEGAAPRGFGPPVVLAGPTARGMTIRRTTLDGAFRLDQVWTSDGPERDLTVQMRLTNLGATPTSTKLRLLRIVDVDAEGTSIDDFDRSRVATWTRETAAVFGQAVVVSSLSSGATPTTAITTFATANRATPPCAPTSLAVPGLAINVAAFVMHDLGPLKPGRTATVKVGYRLQ